MNMFGITSIIIFFAGLGFGLFLYSSDRTSKVNKWWFIVSIFTALWGLALYGVTSTTSSETALGWQYLLDFSAIFIPITYFSFVCELLGLKKIFLRWLLFCAGVLLAVFSVTPYFKMEMVVRYGFFWINPGHYYIIFPIFFFVVIFVSLFFLVRGYILSKNIIFRAQIRNTLLAGLIGFGGGITNFFPQIINIYPFGNYFVLLYVIFMSYGVLKYKLISKKVISAQLFAGAIVLVFLFNLLQPDSLPNWAIKFLLFVLISIFSYLLVRGVYKEIEQKEELAKLNVNLQTVIKQRESLEHLVTHKIKGSFTRSKCIFAGILDGTFGEMNEEVKKRAKEGLDSDDMGIETVDLVLNANNLQKGAVKYDMQRIDFKEIVLKTIEEKREPIETKGLKLETETKDGPCNVLGDAFWLKEVVNNLIENSFKYTKEGKITVGLEDGNGKIKFYVKDTGMGITEEDKKGLFTEGGRGKESVKVNVDSTGYGLYTVKLVVDAHKGRVWAESEGPGKGSQFFVELPKV